MGSKEDERTNDRIITGLFHGMPTIEQELNGIPCPQEVAEQIDPDYLDNYKETQIMRTQGSTFKGVAISMAVVSLILAGGLLSPLYNLTQQKLQTWFAEEVKIPDPPAMFARKKPAQKKVVVAHDLSQVDWEALMTDEPFPNPPVPHQ